MKPQKFDASPPPRLPALDPLPSSGATWLDKLDLAIQALAIVGEPFWRLDESRPKGSHLEALRQKMREAHAAAEEIFFGQGRAERPERRDAQRLAASKDALASAEKDRAIKLADGESDQILDEAELAVRRAARAVEREIVAAAALDKEEAAARKAALDAAWDRLWPAYLELQNEFTGHLRATLSLAEKIRRINWFVQGTGACPAVECMPGTGDEFFFSPAVIEDYAARVEKAGEWHAFFLAKRSVAA
ncbi:MAG: hypothetical protein ACT4O2_06330 [Beijerinckiaceae bacterium]